MICFSYHDVFYITSGNDMEIHPRCIFRFFESMTYKEQTLVTSCIPPPPEMGKTYKGTGPRWNLAESDIS